MVEFTAIIEDAGQEYRDCVEVKYCEDGLTVSRMVWIVIPPLLEAHIPSVQTIPKKKSFGSQFFQRSAECGDNMI